MTFLRWHWLDSHEADTGWRGGALEAALAGVGALLWTCALAPPIQLFLGSRQGWLRGHSIQSWVGPWLMVLAGYAVARVTLGLRRKFPFAVTVMLALFALAASWLWTTAAWPILDYPLRTWNYENSWFAPVLLLGTLFPLTGAAWCLRQTDHLELEGYRKVVRGGLITLVATGTWGLTLSSILGLPTIPDMVSTATWSVPLYVVSAAVILGIVHHRETRDQSARANLEKPGWSRTFKLIGGVALGTMAAAMIALAATGQNVLEVFVWIGQAFLMVAFVVLAVPALLWAGVTYIAAWLVGIRPHSPATMLAQWHKHTGGGGSTTSTSTPAWILWVGIGATFALLCLVFLGGMRVRAHHRRNVASGEKENIFSFDLLQQQLRSSDPREVPHHLRRVRLTRSPADIREAMLFLQALAHRRGVAMRRDESAADFVARLKSFWPDVAPSLDALVQAYEPHRYGTTPTQGVSAWTTIYEADHANHSAS